MDKNKMLIDATHPEETRVVVLRQGRVEEFDYESASRKLLRGNIYLAKVTRVEPSLQAAFVDYGGNRHGFLAFNEIHPDYYQIPVADRQMLLQEEAEAEARAEEEADAAAEDDDRHTGRRDADDDESDPLGLEPQPYIDDAPDAYAARGAQPAAIDEPYGQDERRQDDDDAPDADAAPDQEHDRDSDADTASADAESDAPEGADITEVDAPDADQVEQVGTEDAMEEVPERPRRRMRSYKIQEVIKRRQIILVQVVKEERGNKGAALTTYLSLAGRYTVLMPNTGRGGGISRKITNAQDRRRLKSIAHELEVPEGMGLIIRTAGAARTKQEIRRDYEYLLRLWESVRDMTLLSTAPCLVYEEGNLIKRSIRDLYSKDIGEIVVAGEGAHREAYEFMRMLQPSGARDVVAYREAEPLFTRHQIERQLNAMFSPHVTLRSGGYLVINQTEALVSVDVNSGKSTREFSIEETALNTNLEASDEIARQLKLRDLAGLIVIDFIDMEEKRNNRAVERRLKEALHHDRARIQVGRISHFGLLEMSRQRLRTGVLEGSTSQCPHCQGTGIIRSTESVALAVLRGLEDELLKGRPTSLTALTTAQVALYILNHKRGFVLDIERRHQITVSVQASDRMQGASFAIERAAGESETARAAPDRNVVSMDWGFEGEDGRDERAARDDSADEDGSSSGRRRRRGRRGRDGEAGRDSDRGSVRGGRGRQGEDRGGRARPEADDDDRAAPALVEAEGGEAREHEADGERTRDESGARRGRRRGRRGGRNREGRGRRPAAEGDGNGAEAHAHDAVLEGREEERGGNGHHDEFPDEAATEQRVMPVANGEAQQAHVSIRDEHERHHDADHRHSEAMAKHAHASASDDEHRHSEAMAKQAHASASDDEHRHSAPSHETHAAEAIAAREERDSDRAINAPAAEPASSETDDSAQPTRKGWWQKRFGG